MELVCPAGNLPALKTAVDHGADAVYFGLTDNTNARNFAGLNFDMFSARQGINYAHRAGRKVLMAINTYAQQTHWKRWQEAVDTAAELEVDAVILADVGLMAYASERWPNLRLHASVQSAATHHEAVNFYAREFGVQRVVLPRVLTLEQVAHVIKHSSIEIEVFGFGSLCVMLEGKCLLSSYATGESPNTAGVCSPAKSVRWQGSPQGLESRLNGILIDRYTESESAAYPTLCKGRFQVNDETYYALEEPTSLNTLSLLPQLQQAGVAAIKIEGRQRSPVYVAQVVKVWRQALDLLKTNPARYSVNPQWQSALARVSEGQQTTLGAYNRPWK